MKKEYKKEKKEREAKLKKEKEEEEAKLLEKDLTFDDLIQRKGIYYKKNSDVPFTGKLAGIDQGLIKDGKMEGYWVGYHTNGKIKYKMNYKNNYPDGLMTTYWYDGTLKDVIPFSGEEEKAKLRREKKEKEEKIQKEKNEKEKLAQKELEKKSKSINFSKRVLKKSKENLLLYCDYNKSILIQGYGDIPSIDDQARKVVLDLKN